MRDSFSVSSVCSVVYKFPDTTKFGRILPKSTIYTHAKPTAKVKELFVQEVEKIIWSHKLSADTMNIQASDNVKEIQVFSIILKAGELSQEVLHTIDKAIPSPILFALQYDGKIKYTASYKRPSDADKNKWVISSFYGTTEYTEYTEKNWVELPVVLNMGSLYEALLLDLMPLNRRQGETLSCLIERAEKIQKQEREIMALEGKIQKTKQFNRQVELNRKLNILLSEIEDLKK